MKAWLDKKPQYFLLVIIFFLGMGLRFFRLGDAPNTALIDELHFGYIAYSLLETGRDEHGVAWPLIFTGFGDQKLPAYAYSLLPVVAQLGLSVMSIRVPSALAGSLSIVAMYFLARSLGFSRKVGLVAASIMAISPWPFMLSRFGFESNLALFFFLCGWICLLQAVRWLQQQQNFEWLTRATVYIALSAVLLGLTWHSYIAYRPVTLLLSLLVVGMAWWKNVFSWRQVAVFGLVVTLVILPSFAPGVSSSHTARFEQIGIAQDPAVAMEVNENRTFCAAYLPSPVCYALWNKPAIILSTLAMRYWQVYSPQYLGFVGDAHSQYLTVDGFGQFYSLLYVFFVIGVAALLWTATQRPTKLPLRLLLLLLGLLLAPLPSILVKEAQKVRLSPVLPFIVLAMAYGLVLSLNWLKTRVPKVVLWVTIGIFSLSLLFAAASFFVNFHTIHTAKHDALYQSFAPQIWQFVEQNPEARVYLKPFFSDPLMSYAFYTQLDPHAYQEQVVLGEKEASGFQHAVKLGRLEVGEENLLAIGCQALANDQPAVYVTNQHEPEGYTVQKLMSSNGVLTYGYIYDARVSALLNIDHCSQLTPSEKEQVVSEYREVITAE